MTGNPYAIPEDELLARARVAASDQVEGQAEPQLGPVDRSKGFVQVDDGMSGDADGD